MKKKEIIIPSIGTVNLVKSKRAKYINIVVKPIEGVKVSVPELVSFNRAEKFVHSKIEWIETKLQKVKQLEQNISIYETSEHFVTKAHSLVLESHRLHVIKVTVRQGNIYVKYPYYRDVAEQEIQSEIRKGIIRALRIEAKDYIPIRCEEFSKKYNLPYNNIYFKNLKSKWGSCSSENNLNFNIHLMRLPDYLIDYVILHELAHIKIKNHGKEYWEFMKQLTGNPKKYEKQLKEYSTQIF